MTTPHSLQQLLAQIVSIERMETGTLSTYTPAGRSPDSGPYYKLQSWANGKNSTRHVRPEEVAALQEALEGYRRYQELTKQYAQHIIEQTRTQMKADTKKKIQPYSRHCRPNSRRRSKE
jgi:hypothetical protein